MSFKKRLLLGEDLFGYSVGLSDPCISEMTGMVGFDFLWIDTEHSAMDYQCLLMHIIAAHSAGTASLVRIPWNEPYLAKRVLEMGPDGIIFPMIKSAGEAKAAMDACLYPSMGKRGFGPRRACKYELEPLDEYIQDMPNRLSRLVQVEHVDAVNDFDNILKVPYIDGFIIGPCDLAASIGRINELTCDENLAMIDSVVAKCRDAGKAIGICIGDTSREAAAFWRARGINFITVGHDLGAIVNDARNAIANLRQAYGTGE